MLKNYLSIDWGASRIGLAVGDSETRIAIPFKVAADMKEVLAVIKNEKIDKVVIGQPVKMSGEKNNLTSGFGAFFASLKNKISLPIILVDERLSSKAADALSGTKKTKAKQDAVAAMLILQSYFDSM